MSPPDAHAFGCSRRGALGQIGAVARFALRSAFACPDCATVTLRYIRQTPRLPPTLALAFAPEDGAAADAEMAGDPLPEAMAGLPARAGSVSSSPRPR